MKDFLPGICAFFGAAGVSFALAPHRVAGSALGNCDPGVEGLRGIRTGGYLLLALAAILVLVLIYQFVSE